MGTESGIHKVSQLEQDAILTVNDGYRAKNCELAPAGITFARAGNIDNGFHFEDADYFPVADLHKVGCKISQPGDVLFTSKGTVGRFAFVSRDTPRFVYSPQLCFWRSLNHDQIDPRYLYYWMLGPAFGEQCDGVKGQTDMADYVSLRDQRSMQIELPHIRVQRAIARILGTLDDKIELNRRMNQTLEALARAIFKSWFVDFDPVTAKAAGRQPIDMNETTAALFPSEFEESAIGPIPKGWTIGRFGDIADNLRRGVDPSSVEAGTPYIGLEHMPRRQIALHDWGQSDGVSSNKFRFQRGEILFGKLRPYFHKVGVAPTDGVCSTDILVIVPKHEKWFGPTLAHASSDELVQYADGGSTGTKMPRTNWHDLSRYEIIVPPEALAMVFTRLVKPMAGRICDGIHQSRTLASLRDALLPRLLSGELRVKTAEKIVKEVGEV
jgi:type I restriction enzyme, S subunit